MYTTEQYKVLEAERDALAMQVSRMRDVLLDVKPFVSSDKEYNLVADVLAIPDPHTDVIAKHDERIKEACMVELMRQLVEALSDKSISIKRNGKSIKDIFISGLEELEQTK